MSMVPILIASKPLRYNARALAAGDEFRASARDARLLVALGKAEVKPVPVMRVTSPPVQPAILDVPIEPRKRSYKRRDMTAEGTDAQALQAALDEPAHQNVDAFETSPNPDF